MGKRSEARAKVSPPGLLNDVIFKLVFGGSHSEAVLRYLLNALLALNGEDRIVGLEILNPTPDKVYFDDKGPILDLKAKDEKGTRYNIEVQLKAPGVNYIKRSLYYTTRMYAEQLKSGHEYHLLAKSVSISLLDFTLFPHSDKLHSTFSLWDQSQNIELTDDLELHYIELPKFVPDKPRSVQTRFEKWLYALKFSDLYHTRELPENIKDEEGIQMAIDGMRKAYARDDIRAMIEAQEKAERDRISMMGAARRQGLAEGREAGLELGIAEGRAEGLATGRAEGLATGRAEGRAEGRDEGRDEGRSEGLELVARNMLEAGQDMATIARFTGLPEEKLLALRDSLGLPSESP